MLLEDRIDADGRRPTIGAILLDRSFRILEVSEGRLADSGIGVAGLVGTEAIALVHPDDVARAAAVLDEVACIPGERSEGLYRLRLDDGSHGSFTIQAINLDGEQDGAIVIEIREPTPYILSQAFADDAVDAMSMFAEDIGLDDSLDWVARVAERHVPGLQIVITTFEDDGENRVFSRGPIPPAVAEVNRAARPDALPIHVEVAFKENSQRAWRTSRKIASLDYILPGRLTSILADREGALVGYVEALRPTAEPPDAAEWRVHGMISRMMTAALHRYEFDRQLRRAADLDPLTGLLNRRKLFEVLADDQQLAGSLLYLIDLDRFSWVNNNLGHQAGDETLKAIAGALVHVCPAQARIARLGGDEFVVWIPADQASHDLEELGGEISNVMVIPAGVGDSRVWVRGSIGMVRIAPGEAAADALNRADIAMYASKRSGGDVATLG